MHEEIETILNLVADKKHHWQNKDNYYWYCRLLQEVGELGSSLVGDHEDLPEHELRQIASISINWLAKLRRDR